MDEIDFDLELDDFTSQADFDVDMNLDSFQLDMSNSVEFETRYIKPRIRPEIKAINLKYKHASDLGKQLKAEKNMRAYCIVDGGFIFGDFIEGFITENELFIKTAYISTLSMSQDNIDSLHNLLTWGCVDNLNLIVSAYFFAHERKDLVEYIYEKLDIDNRFQLAVASSHCKTCCLETTAGEYYTIHGSANLRSSSNLEQFCIEEGKELYDFNIEYQSRIIELYHTINKPIRRNRLWQAVQTDIKTVQAADVKPPKQADVKRQAMQQKKALMEAQTDTIYFKE